MKQHNPLIRPAFIIVVMLAVAACNGINESQQKAQHEVTTPSTNTAARPRPTPQGEPREAEVAVMDQAAPGSTAPVLRKEGKAKMEEFSMRSRVAGLASIRPPSAGVNRERYAKILENGVKSVQAEPVSTFSIDVDTGAYAIVRRTLNHGQLPPTDAVRIEELINYFDYDYPAPHDSGRPFSIITEVGRTPWNPRTHLVHVGIQGKHIDASQRPASNLVFLIDVSGSMRSQDKLPLLKSAFKLLTRQLNEKDRVTMVVYAGASGVVLEPTPGNEQGTIMAALERLSAGGSTHGSAGIRLAYAMAEQARIEGGINRVILATDGDFNVGTVNHEQLMDLIEQQRAKGITLTTLGFGQGNYNDYLMEQLADKGNGNYAYIDTINEAQKVLVDELGATLETIARDVKIQIEWNPAVVAEYRLIGYENRQLAREDFNNDKVDAGDIGAGHSVTALYEVTLVDGDTHRLDPLRYASRSETQENRDELAFLRLRYKKPEGAKSRLIEQPIRTRDMVQNIAATSEAYRFSAAVAGFGQLLRGGKYTEQFGYAAVAELARGARGEDRFGYRGEFVRLVKLAASLDARQ